jgi:hypothetical protein
MAAAKVQKFGTNYASRGAGFARLSSAGRNGSRVQRFVPDEKRISRIRLELRGVQVEIFGQAHTLCGAIPTIFGSLLMLIMSIR